MFTGDLENRKMYREENKCHVSFYHSGTDRYILLTKYNAIENAIL